MIPVYQTANMFWDQIVEQDPAGVLFIEDAATKQIRNHEAVRLWNIGILEYKGDPKDLPRMPEVRAWCKAVHDRHSAFIACAVDTPSLAWYLRSLFDAQTDSGEERVDDGFRQQIQEYARAAVDRIAASFIKAGRKQDAAALCYDTLKRISAAVNVDVTGIFSAEASTGTKRAAPVKSRAQRPKQLLTPTIRRQLLQNGRRAAVAGDDPPDFLPVVKLFTPDAAAVWLLTHVDPENPTIAFGLCDLGQGFPEMGPVSLTELEKMRGPKAQAVERDTSFRPTKTINAYSDEARKVGRINA